MKIPILLSKLVLFIVASYFISSCFQSNDTHQNILKQDSVFSIYSKYDTIIKEPVIKNDSSHFSIYRSWRISRYQDSLEIFRINVGDTVVKAIHKIAKYKQCCQPIVYHMLFEDSITIDRKIFDIKYLTDFKYKFKNENVWLLKNTNIKAYSKAHDYDGENIYFETKTPTQEYNCLFLHDAPKSLTENVDIFFKKVTYKSIKSMEK